MELSTRTLEILKNFSTINCNLFIEQGTNLLRTVSESKNIFAEVEVEETFPENVGILNLHKLLQIISMFNKPIFTFSDTDIEITEAEARDTFIYYYTDPSCLTYPKGSVRDFPTPVTFTLNESMIGQITQASRVTQLPDIKINYDENVVSLQLLERKNPTSNVLSLQVDGQGEEPMEAFMKVENLKVMAGDYNVLISDKASRLKSLSPELKTLEYCIAMDLTNV